MTDCTPAQARELANAIADDAVDDFYQHETALRSLANQVEALTAENANILRASLYSADLATQAMEDVKTLTAEHDVLSAVVSSYERVGIVAHDGMNAKVGWTKPVRHNTMLFAVKDPK